MNLHGRHIVLGVSGGVAAYKAVEVTRRLVDAGAYVSPILTRNAQRFIGAATFSALGSEPARTSLYDAPEASPHTHLARLADLIVVVPATANLLSVYANGGARDLLSATLLASRAPVVVCPAMHTEMWEHPGVQENIATLVRRGVHIVAPESGRLAGGDTGVGRLAEPVAIVDRIATLLGEASNIDTVANRPSRPPEQSMVGLKVLVTAGGTREPVDPVRYIGNRSSGKQGYALATEAAERGADVVLVTTVDRPLDVSVNRIMVETAHEMATAVLDQAPHCDIIVMAAAVADFRPVVVADRKLKKGDGPPEIELEPTLDILAELGRTRRVDQTLVGFAAETNDVDANATAKLFVKGAQLMVANNVAEADVGFGHDTNAVTIHFPNGGSKVVALTDKRVVASAVLDAALTHRLTTLSPSAVSPDTTTP